MWCGLQGTRCAQEELLEVQAHVAAAKEELASVEAATKVKEREALAAHQVRTVLDCIVTVRGQLYKYWTVLYTVLHCMFNFSRQSLRRYTSALCTTLNCFLDTFSVEAYGRLLVTMYVLYCIRGSRHHRCSLLIPGPAEC